MNEEKASRILTILVPTAILLCLIGLVLELQNIGSFTYPKFAFGGAIIMVICYIIGKKSFPEWSKNR
jgi:hypothetical protein